MGGREGGVKVDFVGGVPAHGSPITQLAVHDSSIQAQQQLHPGTTYQHMSGGDPSAITDLTYQGLKDFHSEYYHPSNARFYS